MSDIGAPTVVAPNGTTSTQQADGSYTLAAPASKPVDNTTIPGTGGGNALLVTSNAARTTTANNVAKLQSITAPAAGTPGSSTNGGANAQQPTDSGTAAGHTININTGGGSTAAPTGGLTSEQLKSAGISDVTGWTQSQGADGNTVFTPPTTPAGSTTPGQATGTPDANAAAVASIKDPALASQFKSSLDALDSQVNDAKSNLDAAQATLANDPAAAAAVQQIKDLYDKQIQLMKDKNAQVIGKANTSVAAFGGLGVMGQDFLNNQQQKADQRVSDLVAKEQDLILKAQIAYKTNDMKALNTAMTEYNKANADKLKAINNLLTETNKQVSQAQAQQRNDLAAQKAQVATDISKSTNLATAIAKNIADAGITDKGQIDSYVKSMAESAGITNPDILASAVAKAQAASDKAAGTAANQADLIKNRDARMTIAKNKAAKTPAAGTTKSKTDGGYTYTPQDISTYASLMNKGGTGPDGTKYAARGKDSYVDPQAYIATYNDWIKNNGTPKGFLKEFPITNVNPASIPLLPAGIQPKAKTLTQANPPA